MSVQFKATGFLLALGMGLVGSACGGVPGATRNRGGTVLIYGATSSGVVAAVAAARLGSSVTLVDPTLHVGGMSSSGLGYTDSGSIATITGIAREFYTRVGAEYGKPEPVFVFEPHVAERVFEDFLDHPNVTVVRNTRIASVIKSGSTLLGITTDDGRTLLADFFIDSTYEGDLLALAAVSYVVGREANSLYGESMNGVRPPEPIPGLSIDPFITPGDPTSGLLPAIEPISGHSGTADAQTQPYNYRLCLTRDPANRIPLTPPPVYDRTEYELVGRYLAALAAAGRPITFGLVVSLGPLPNGKFDANNAGPFSTDLIGASRTYPETTGLGRAAIAKAHEQRIRGLFEFLRTDGRVPPALRDLVASYGLCGDEFVASGGWPPQLYVREARRMRGAYVVTEHDAFARTTVPDGVALASYPIDAHYGALVVHEESVATEGGLFEQLPRPFPVSYRALAPSRSEAHNLLVSVCVSASHVAYGSIRMEPVLMMLGQAAGTAAALAAPTREAAEDLSFSRLRSHLYPSSLTSARPHDSLQ